MTIRQAFDHLATNYDAHFTHTEIGRYLRRRVQARLHTHFRVGDHVLELGCGTGEDALHLVQHGIHVTATDASEAMLAAAREKTRDNSLVELQQLDLQELDDSLPGLFDGAFSNFGALNCLGEWRTLANWLAVRVKPGGVIGLGVMSPFCLWEMGWHGVHGDFKTATRRLRKGTTFQPASSIEPIQVYYPTIRRLVQDFAPHFRRIHVEAVGLFLPPSGVFAVVEKRPHLMKLLIGLEARFAKYRALALFGDHYWVELERTDT